MMKYHSFADEEKNPDTNWYYSIKINGFWCKWKKNGDFVTKNDRVLFNSDNITNYEIIGEIYNKNKKNLLKIGVADINDFYAFDVVLENQEFEERLKILRSLSIQQVSYKKIESKENWELLKQEAIDKKYEGYILRDPKGLIQINKRSKTTLKWKPKFYSTAKIIKKTQKKKGITYLLEDIKTKIQFHIYSGKKVEENAEIKYKYNGITSNGKPDLPYFSKTA
jgi:hypothetical protein